MEIEELNNILNEWKHIEGGYNYIKSQVDSLETKIRDVFNVAYSDKGIFLGDDSIDLLSKELADFGIDRDTINRLYNDEVIVNRDAYEFINSLKIIVKAKINAETHNTGCPIQLK